MGKKFYPPVHTDHCKKLTEMVPLSWLQVSSFSMSPASPDIEKRGAIRMNDLHPILSWSMLFYTIWNLKLLFIFKSYRLEDNLVTHNFISILSFFDRSVCFVRLSLVNTQPNRMRSSSNNVLVPRSLDEITVFSLDLVNVGSHVDDCKHLNVCQWVSRLVSNGRTVDLVYYRENRFRVEPRLHAWTIPLLIRDRFQNADELRIHTASTRGTVQSNYRFLCLLAFFIFYYLLFLWINYFYWTYLLWLFHNLSFFRQKESQSVTLSCFQLTWVCLLSIL